ncbi:MULTISPECIES: DsbA family oxidoreductase [unclassified Aeromicrobium]|uniref:DsbA family oxidoreductase n=1 Tax=unclassified Aeromicrobium TaxID=2633570 RepID=UPI00257BA195|nr:MULTISPECIES: DsbA family oxidoreductase [unclassified Aeromicrobium]
MKATVFCDVTDPWSYVGATRFERAAGMFTILVGEPVEVAFRARLLDPDAPSSGRPLREVQAERLGGEDKVDLVDAQVTAAARISGIELNLVEAVEANSLDAWRLLTWADEAAPGAQRELIHQLWRAHFLEGADVADPLVLASRAALVGLDLETADALLASEEYADAVRTQDETARSLGITQLPYVVVEHRWTLAGPQSQDDYVQALHQIHQEWRSDSPS